MNGTLSRATVACFGLLLVAPAARSTELPGYDDLPTTIGKTVAVVEVRIKEATTSSTVNGPNSLEVLAKIQETIAGEKIEGEIKGRYEEFHAPPPNQPNFHIDYANYTGSGQELRTRSNDRVLLLLAGKAKDADTFVIVRVEPVEKRKEVQELFARKPKRQTADTRAESQITVTVSCNKAEYAKGEHIVVSATVKNASDRTFTVPNGTLKADGLPRAIDANVKTEDSAIYVPMGLPGPLEPPARRHFAALEPAKAITVTFTIDPRLWHAPGGRLADRAGRYTIQCRFVNRDREYWDTDMKDSKGKPDNMWIGESDWAETQITVKEIPPSDGQRPTMSKQTEPIVVPLLAVSTLTYSDSKGHHPAPAEAAYLKYKDKLISVQGVVTVPGIPAALATGATVGLHQPANPEKEGIIYVTGLAPPERNAAYVAIGRLRKNGESFSLEVTQWRKVKQ